MPRTPCRGSHNPVNRLSEETRSVSFPKTHHLERQRNPFVREATPRFPRKNRRCSAARLTARLRGAVWLVLATLAEPFNEKPVTEYTGSAPRTHRRMETGTEDPPLRTIWPAPHERPNPKAWPPAIERAHGSETESAARKAHGTRQFRTPKALCL